jgi:hypothetical protein
MSKVLGSFAIVAALFIATSVGALADTQHISGNAQGSGPDRGTATQNGYAAADNVLRTTCSVSYSPLAYNTQLQNEQQDSASCNVAGNYWTCQVAVEADCVATSRG